MPDVNEDILQKLASSIVEIISDKKEEQDSSTLGTGFVVTDDGLIVTCRHVVTDAEDKLMDTAWARFYSDFIDNMYDPDIDKIPKYKMTLVEEYNQDPLVDVAFFKLDVTSMSQGNRRKLAPVELDDNKVITLNEFASIGFKKANRFAGLSAYGTIGILTRKKTEDGLLSPEVIELHHDRKIQPGMSGAPVFDKKSNRVVGIITERYNPVDFNDEEFALALPVKSMIELYPKLREKNPGLVKFNNFLAAIGKSGSFMLERLELLYVPPIEYKEIEKTLRAYRYVLITGTPEYGKTYTAIKLLWEFYKTDGYSPRYIEEGSAELTQIMKRLSEQYDSLKHSIIYIEDPLGKIDYKSNKEFEESIGSVIPSLRRLDCYLVVTMREDLYKKFDPLGKKQLEGKHVKKLNIGNHSFNYEKRKEMTQKYAQVMNCGWYQNQDLRNTVLEVIKNEGKLPTPLNIKDFSVDTDETHKVFGQEELMRILDYYSQRTPERFARDIKTMSEDKILFLTFPFISEKFSIDDVKSNYKELAKEFRIRASALKFDQMVDCFVNDKIIDVYHYWDEYQQYKAIGFSHASYFEAFSLAISENGSLTKPGKVLSKVLFNLRAEYYYHVADNIARNFDKLPKELQNRLFETAEHDYHARNTINAVKNNFDKLPPNVRNKLLLKGANTAYGVYDTILAIADNFDKLPPNVRNKLLLKAATYSPYAAGELVRLIADNFNKLPKNIQMDLVFKLVNDVYDIGKGYDEYARFDVSEAFDKLPSNVRNHFPQELRKKIRKISI